MTKDIIVVTDTDVNNFSQKVYREVTKQEEYGYTCEIKFSTVEKDNAFGKVQYNALIHAYEE